MGNKILGLVVGMVSAVIVVIIGVNILVELLPEMSNAIATAVATSGGLYGLSGASLLSLLPGMLLLVFGAGTLIAVVVMLVKVVKGGNE